MIARRLTRFGTSIFGEMTRLANEHGAVNLSQGFPDFDGPAEVFDWARQAMRDGLNQYTRSMGLPALVTAIAANLEEDYGLRYDPMTEVCVTSGATEAIAAAIFGLLEPGDEAVLFEPFYDSYPPCVTLAGGAWRALPLRFPDFAIDFDRLRALIGPRTRLIVMNTPHNPSGKVFTRQELEGIAELAQRHDLIVVSDEVYEHLTYDGARHLPIAAIDGMRERALGISSTGKTYSLTGFKIGWAWGAKPLVAAVAAAHQFLTFATATPFQAAMARALREFRGPWLERLRADYLARRDFLLGALAAAGFTPARPRGSYFILASFERLFTGSDVEFARRLVERHKVAAIPPSSFYSEDQAEGACLLRFAFCKRLETLQAAAERLQGITR